MHDPASELPRTPLPRTSVNKARRGDTVRRLCDNMQSQEEEVSPEEEGPATVAKPSSQRLLPLDVSPSSSCRGGADAAGNACGAGGYRCGGNVSCYSGDYDYEIPPLALHLLPSNDSCLSVRPANPQPYLCEPSKV